MDAEREGRHTDNALVGWILVVGLTLVGYLLLVLGGSDGGPAWPRLVFLVIGVAGVIVLRRLGLSATSARLERQLPENRERWAKLEGELIAAFEQLGAGDLVRSARAHAGRCRSGWRASRRRRASSLSALAQQIQDSSIEVASAADAVNQIASDLASGSSQQAASVVEITAAMEELARTASQIAENATRQAELAARAEASGDAGSAAVYEAVAGVEEVQKRISAIANRADALGTRSKEIYRVLDLITEIAQETHILSLNAAIEAVAAGRRRPALLRGRRGGAPPRPALAGVGRVGAQPARRVLELDPRHHRRHRGGEQGGDAGCWSARAPRPSAIDELRQRLGRHVAGGAARSRSPRSSRTRPRTRW